MKIKPIYVFAKWRVKSGELDNVLHLLTKVAMKSTMEEGNLFYKASRCNKDHNTIIVFEGYRDEEAQNKHQSTDHVRKLILGQIVPLLEEKRSHINYVALNTPERMKPTLLDCRVTYIGGPTILLEIGGLRLMTDPTLDPAGTSFVLNEKMTESKLSGPALHPEGQVDVVLLSHDQHFDNLDHSGRALLKNTVLTITTKSGAQRLLGSSVGLAEGEHLSLTAPSGCKIKITAVPARHGPAGIERITGEVIGFHLMISGTKNYEIYITGDTVFYSKIAALSKQINPKYIFIFAGAARPRGPFNLTMGTNDALDTADAFPEAIIIPIHSEGWSHYTENNDNLKEAFRILEIGHRLMLLKPGLPTPLFEQ